MKRYSAHDVEESPDGEFVRFEELAAHVEAIRIAIGKDLGAHYAEQEAELTRWRAIFSSPETARRAFEEFEARNRGLGDELGKSELRIQQLEHALDDIRARLTAQNQIIDQWVAFGSTPSLAKRIAELGLHHIGESAEDVKRRRTEEP